jgi:hypothetical protein
MQNGDASQNFNTRRDGAFGLANKAKPSQILAAREDYPANVG